MKQSVERVLTTPTFQALHYPNFRWFWFSNACQAVGQGMLLLTLGWLVLDLIDLPLMVGIVSQMFSLGFYYSIPYFTVVLLGGIIADRIDRRALLLFTQASVAVVILGVAILTILDLVVVEHLYAAAFLLGTLHAFNGPARLAIVVNLVGRDDIMNAVALNSAVLNAGRIVGPLLVGVVISLADFDVALYLVAFCYSMAVGFLLLLRGVEQTKPPQRANVLRDLRAGLDYFRQTPVVFTVIGIGFAFWFFGMKYIQVMPSFTQEVFDVFGSGAEEFGANELGLLTLAAGVGSLLVNIILASLGNTRGKNWLLLGSILTFTVSLFMFAWSEWYWLSLVILIFVGIGSGGFISLGITVLQLTAKPELQGRVMSFWNVSAGFISVGILPMYLLVDWVSWPAALAGGAGICLFCILVLGVWRPTLRRLRI